MNKNEQRILLFSVFILSLCGITYELVLGSLATYLLGNPVQQYSITIGFFLSSMGLGTYLSRFFNKNMLKTFITIEVILGAVGGLSVLVLSYLFSFSTSYYLLHLLVLSVIGMLVGLEIPLITRILKEYGALKDILSNVLSLDYIGGLVGSLMFPLVLYPIIGRMLTSILIGVLNVAIALVIIYKLKYQGKKKSDYLMAIFSLIILAVVAFNSKGINNIIEKRLYREDILYKKRTTYQEIVLTRNGSEFKLFLDGALQFSSMDEYRYHEMLIMPALNQVKGDKLDVLVLGGGDGLAVRELNKSSRIRTTTLVELDPEMISLAKENSTIKRINKKSLADPRVKVVTGDAYVFLRNSKKRYDIIYADFPDPHDETISKLYSTTFYRMVKGSLKTNGIFVSQSTSPFFATKAFWCIHNTLGTVFKNVTPYHVYIPSFGDWGFNMATNEELGQSSKKDNRLNNRYYSPKAFEQSLHFSTDIKHVKTEINSFNKPVVYRYYLQGWKNSMDY